MDKAATTTAVDVRQFGAIGDGTTVCTDAFNQAIRYAAESGLSHVIVPPGHYVTGTVVLESQLTLELQHGAKLQASPNLDDFPEYHDNDRGNRHLLYAADKTGITIRGGGVIDGNVRAYTDGFDETPPYTWTACKEPRVRPLLDFQRCRHIRITDVTLRDSPGWTTRFYCCDEIWIRGVKMYNYVFAGNSDGFDFVGCRDVVVSDCMLETGDDALVFKTEYGSRSCERVAITNCIIKTNCAALRLGAETWHDYRHFTFSNSVIHASNRAVDITSQDGAIIEDITVSNLTIDTNGSLPLNRAIHLELRKGRGEWGHKLPLEQMKLGAIRRVLISNVSLKTDGRILLTAADGGMLEDIVLRDITMHLPWIEDPVAVGDHIDFSQTSGYNPEARVARAALVAENARNLRLINLQVSWPAGPVGGDFLPKTEKGRALLDPHDPATPRPPFHAIWGRGLEGGFIDCYGLRASREDTEAVHLEQSAIEIIGA